MSIQDWANKQQDPEAAALLVNRVANRVHNVRLHNDESTIERQGMELIVDRFVSERGALTRERLQKLDNDIRDVT